MRDSVGAMWIFAICLVFIIMMIAYLSISVNYARAFRIKNHIISMIEEHEGYDNTLDQDIEDYFDYEGPIATGPCANNISASGESWEFKKCLGQDVNGRCSACIYKTHTAFSKMGPTESARYRVMTFFKFDIPVVSSLMTFQVGGDSRSIYNFAKG